MYPIRITFTPLEKACILHRLGNFTIAECVNDDEEASDERYERLCDKEATLAAELNQGYTVTVFDKEDEEIIVDAYEGSTWWACMEGESLPASAKAAATSLHGQLQGTLARAFPHRTVCAANMV